MRSISSKRRAPRGEVLKRLFISAASLAVLGAVGWVAFLPDPNALRSIVETRCLGNLAGPPVEMPPCVKVDRALEYVILKDRKGDRHYLLLPTRQITGIESEELLANGAPNYFELAWENRGLLSKGLTQPLADDEVSLAINSEVGRTQNQLHIHISCMKQNVREKIVAAKSDISETWQPFPGGLEGHDYWARRVTQAQFKEVGAFTLLAFGTPMAASRMDRFSLAMTEVGGDVVLLATERDLFDLNLASAEELQDHECKGSPAKPASCLSDYRWLSCQGHMRSWGALRSFRESRRAQGSR